MHCKITLVEPQPAMVDMVFAANGALLHNKTALLSNFKVPSRQDEVSEYRRMLSRLNYDIHETQSFFEGQGDALFCEHTQTLWMGYGFRTDLDAQNDLENIFNYNTVPLQLVNPHFYHLDTCFCPLYKGHVMYYPNAFDRDSVHAIRRMYGTKAIAVSKTDASQFVCNAVNIKSDIIVNKITTKLRTKLELLGYTVTVNDTSEFILSGGSCKCMVLHR
jgi:N-dimethylarginine dimethylaminohydrolase